MYIEVSNTLLKQVSDSLQQAKGIIDKAIADRSDLDLLRKSADYVSTVREDSRLVPDKYYHLTVLQNQIGIYYGPTLQSRLKRYRLYTVGDIRLNSLAKLPCSYIDKVYFGAYETLEECYPVFLASCKELLERSFDNILEIY